MFSIFYRIFNIQIHQQIDIALFRIKQFGDAGAKCVNEFYFMLSAQGNKRLMMVSQKLMEKHVIKGKNFNGYL